MGGSSNKSAKFLQTSYEGVSLEYSACPRPRYLYSLACLELNLVPRMSGKATGNCASPRSNLYIRHKKGIKNVTGIFQAFSYQVFQRRRHKSSMSTGFPD